MVATSFTMLAGLAILVLAIAGLANRGTRPYGLAVLGVGLLAMLLFSVRVSHSPQPIVVAPEAPLPPPLFDVQAEVERVRLQSDAEIVKNQRLAARMDDAFVQTSPDGSTLETYPDGMQISQRGYDSFRSIVRPADGDAHVAFGSHSYSTRSEVKLWIIGAPLLALAVAFLALRKRKPGGGSGVAWVLAGSAALVLFGLTFYGSQRRVTVMEPHPQQIAQSNFDPFGISIQSNSELSRVHKDLLQSPQVAAQRESIESLWNKLTQPKIKLDASASPEMKATRQELVHAAKTILSASAPGADPFTQGWLINAAKAIVNAGPKGGEEIVTAAGDLGSLPKDSSVQPSMDDDIAATPAAAKRAVKPTAEPAQAKPDWLVNSPKLVGNTRRIVVSTDPYSTVEECHAALRQELLAVVHARLTELAQAANGGAYAHVPELDHLGIRVEYILAELCPEEYLETMETSVGSMERVHTLLEFNESQDQFLLDRWLDYARKQSIELVGGLSASIVAGLGMIFGLLKLDTWTRGYYTKRLFLGIPAAIIAVLAVATLLGA